MVAADDGAHAPERVGELLRGDGPQIPGDQGAPRDDVVLARRVAPRLGRMVLDVGPAQEQAGRHGQIRLAPKLLVERVQDPRGLEDRAAAVLLGEDAG